MKIYFDGLSIMTFLKKKSRNKIDIYRIKTDTGRLVE